MFSEDDYRYLFFFLLLQTPQLCLPHKQQPRILTETVEFGSRRGELIYPPVETECMRAASVGTVPCVFNASLRGGMGMQPVSGSGHIQYAGITPGSSEEMRTLALSLPSRAVDKKNNQKWREQKCPSRRSVCPVDSPRREISEKMEDWKGLREGKHAVAAAAAAADGFMMHRKLHVFGV